MRMARRAAGGDIRVLQPFKRAVPNTASPLEFSTTAETSRRMGGVRQRGTTPELEVRHTLRRSGLHYTLRNRDLPGSPDLANRSRRFAVFVHGCFWHQHPDCRFATIPKRNREFWLAKFAANRRRDARSVGELRQRGYTVLVVWECEAADPDALLQRVKENLVRRGGVCTQTRTRFRA